VARAALDGISRGQGEAGADIGAAEEVPVEETLESGEEDSAVTAAAGEDAGLGAERAVS
jgi:small subunit ribosomal protein S2